MVFKKFANSKHTSLFIGAPEAEAESLPTSKVFLKDVYEDHHNLFNELEHEKFIVVGRKGCGKSAFAEYTLALAESDANLFCSFIRQDNVSLETLVQLGQTAGVEQTKEHLFKWLVYTNILKLFFSNEAAQQDPQYKLIVEFLKKNSGYINIDKGEVIELVKKHKFEISIEQFKRFFRSKYNQDIEIKEARAPYYKLLPHLERVVLDILTSKENVDNENSYVIFFDDLDIGFKANNNDSVDTLISLLRTVKHINNNVFARNHATAKVIILIRDDVERLLAPLEADIAKIFSSYSTTLNWYQEEFVSNNKEDEIGLKKLINRRATYAFTKAMLPMPAPTPWGNLVGEHFYPKTSFKYVADHTFLRPRDFILFFKPLETGSYALPLNRPDVNSLLGQYATEMMREISNELSSFYEAVQIQCIFDALKKIAGTYDCTYENAIKSIEEHCKDVNPAELLQDLFERSIIGGINPLNRHVKFKYRESKRDGIVFNLDYSSFVIVHSGIKIYLQNR